MLRIYRAPKTTPGQTTLQADEGTWAVVIDRIKRGQNSQAVHPLLEVLRGMGEHDLARGASPPRHEPGSGPVLRVSVPDALARTILEVAA